MLRRRQRGEAISTPNPNLHPPPQSIPLEYLDDAPSAKRAVKIEKISLYHGKSIREHQDFRDSLKLAFHLKPNAFANKDTRVMFII